MLQPRWKALLPDRRPQPRREIQGPSTRLRSDGRHKPRREVPTQTGNPATRWETTPPDLKSLHPDRRPPAQTGGTSPDRGNLSQIGGPSAQNGGPSPRQEAPTQAGGPLQTESPSPGGRLFSPDCRPLCPPRLEPLRPDGRPSQDRRLPAHTGGPSKTGGPPVETFSPNGNPSAQTGGPQPRWVASGPAGAQTGGPQPKLELPPPRRESLRPNKSQCHGMCHGSRIFQ